MSDSSKVIFDALIGMASDKSKSKIKIDSVSLLSERIVSSIELTSKHFYKNETPENRLLLSIGDVVGFIAEFFRDERGMPYETSLKVISDKAAKYAEEVRKYREENKCNCDECKRERENTKTN